jgi:hypothetical protein
MTFTKAKQQQHRNAFVQECRQNAWSAACNGEYLSNEFEKLMVEFEKLQKVDRDLEEEIKTLESAIDYHTVENRGKRETLQERRNVLAKQIETVGINAGKLQKGMQQLYASVEQNLALAKHAETWEWKEATTKIAERPANRA